MSESNFNELIKMKAKFDLNSKIETEGISIMKGNNTLKETKEKENMAIDQQINTLRSKLARIDISKLQIENKIMKLQIKHKKNQSLIDEAMDKNKAVQNED